MAGPILKPPAKARRQRAAGVADKKRYVAPKLTRYGEVAKLTQSVGTANGDGGSAMMP